MIIATPIDRFWNTALAPVAPTYSWRVALDDEVVAEYCADRFFTSASMIKTFLCTAATELCDSWDTVITVGREHLAAGDGISRHLSLPVRMPIADLVVLIIALSDNTATNAVIESCGGLDPVNEWLANQGYSSRMMRWLSGAGPPAVGTPEVETGIGQCSASEHARIVDHIYENRDRSRHYGILWSALNAQQDVRSLARYVTEETSFAHKTGTVERARHDGGTLEHDGHRLSVSSFTDGGPEEEWPDHPASIAMGRAMAWTCHSLGWSGSLVAGAPALPAFSLGNVALLGEDEVRRAFDEPSVADSLRSRDNELAFWREVRASKGETWGWAILNDRAEAIGLVSLYGPPSGESVDVGIYVYDPRARRRGAAKWAVEQVLAVARVRGIVEVRWTAAASNEASLSLARALGFRHVRTVPDGRMSASGDPLDEVVLVRDLR